jgi:hypothetical protein
MMAWRRGLARWRRCGGGLGRGLASVGAAGAAAGRAGLGPRRSSFSRPRPRPLPHGDALPRTSRAGSRLRPPDAESGGRSAFRSPRPGPGHAARPGCRRGRCGGAAGAADRCT